MRITGINTHLPNALELQQLRNIGIEFVRIDINWYRIEQSPGVYEWAELDAVIANARKLGLAIYATLAYTPSWAGERISSIPPAKEWAEFVEQVALRYGEKISVYSLWNEPNLGQFFDGDVDDYIINVLVPGAEVLRKYRHIIAAPDLATQNSNWCTWLRRLATAKSYFDIVSIHCYKDTVAEVAKRFHKGRWPWLQWLVPSWRPYFHYLRRLAKQVWLTELGWDSAKIGEQEQASQYRELLRQGIPTVVGIFTYELRDDPGIKQKWGVLRSDLQPKPAFAELM